MRRLAMLTVVAALFLAACGGGNSKENGPASGATAASGGATAQGSTAPKGELKVGFGIHMPATLDATKDGFSLIFVGAGETLTRLTRDNQVEPWLAESVTQLDPLTWRAVLRSNARFHDGSAVTAEEVVGSFRRNWESQPAAGGFIPKETRVTAVDARTVELKTPRPVGGFTNNLSAPQFVVHKPGASGSVMTGPYRPVRLETDNQMTLEAFSEHWGGPPPIAKITIKLLPDANARALALQSGDVDMVFAMPPQIANDLPGDIEKAIIPSTRVHLVLFNHARAPFNDRAVREALSLAIDREALNKVTLEGLGAVTTAPFAPVAGVDVLPPQRTDVNRARQILDEAGWKAGSDGVRAKDGRRLSFTLYSYPGRNELTPMGVAIQGQLKPLGFDVQIQQVQNITALLKEPDWDATMYSMGTMPTGDPLYMFNQNLVTGAGGNAGAYSSARLDAVVEQLRGELDPAKRQALSLQAQEIVRADAANAYLVGAPVVYLYKKGKVQGFVPHPNDVYFIDREMSVR